MTKAFIIITHVAIETIDNGFLPKIYIRSLPVVIVTDHIDQHRHLKKRYPGLKLLSAEVFNPLAVIQKLKAHSITPAAVFCNSDHLQSAAAIVSDYFNVFGKDWKAALICKNKVLMRDTLRQLEMTKVQHLAVSDIHQLNDQLDNLVFPLIIKPAQGVASIDVRKVNDKSKLVESAKNIWQKNPERLLIIESYLDGTVMSIETIGSKGEISVLGGFITDVATPYFIEYGASWCQFPQEIIVSLLSQLKALGVGFGACHSEFVIFDDHVELIEVNYRSVGDYKEFMLDQIFNHRYFDAIIDLYLYGHYQLPKPEMINARIDYIVNQSKTGKVLAHPASYSLDQSGSHQSLKLFKRTGDRLEIQHSNKDYLGALYRIQSDEITPITSDSLQNQWQVAPC